MCTCEVCGVCVMGKCVCVCVCVVCVKDVFSVICAHEGYVGCVCMRIVCVCVFEKGDAERVGLCFCTMYM